MQRVVRWLAGIVLATACAANGAAAWAATLPAAPPIAESFDVGTLHVDRYGSGPQALILLPGLTSGPWEWYGTIAHEMRTYTVYAISLPGFDGRPATTKLPLVTTVIGDLGTLIDQRQIVKPVLVGHSLGGTLALVAGETYPARLKAIVAVDGLPVFPTLATVPAEQRAAIAAQSAAPYAALTHDAFLAGSKQFMATIGTADPTLVDPSAALLATSDPAASGEWIKEILGSDYRPGLVNITVPVIEIMPYYAPDHDHPPLQYTQDQSQSFYESLLGGTPNLAVVPVSGARHFVMLDQPAAFNGALDRALHAVP